LFSQIFGPLASGKYLMTSNEIQLRNHIVNLLAQDGYKTQTEVRLPEGLQVDILAEKDVVTRAIEVKRGSRVIADDIFKCQKLLCSPEVISSLINRARNRG